MFEKIIFQTYSRIRDHLKETWAENYHFIILITEVVTLEKKEIVLSQNFKILSLLERKLSFSLSKIVVLKLFWEASS